MYQIQWGELTAERFLTEFWQQKPLLIRQAFPGIEPLLEHNELAGLALESNVESRLISYRPDESHFELKRGPLDEKDFADLSESHWTLLVQAVDHYIEEAGELLDCFSFIPRWRIDDLMVSYATPGGGVGPHFDNYDVFLIQATGTRRWEIGGLENSQSKRVADFPLLILSDFTAHETYELEPGDMLYLPPQIAHNGVATSADCTTYSVGFRAPSDAEILRSYTDYIGETLAAEQRYTDPKLAPTLHPGALDPASIDRVKSKLQLLLDQPDQLATWFAGYLSEPKYADDLYRPEVSDAQEWIDQLDLDEGVTRASDARLIYIDQVELLLFCNGNALNTDGCNQEWIRLLCDTRHSGPIADTAADRALLQALYLNAGIE